MKTLNIVSTALVADWSKKGKLICTPLTADEFVKTVKSAEEIKNFCGHPKTTAALNESGLNIPPQLTKKDKNGEPILHPKFGTPQGEFWDGNGVAVAARPKGGVRSAAAQGDTEVSRLDDLEFLMFEFISE